MAHAPTQSQEPQRPTAQESLNQQQSQPSNAQQSVPANNGGADAKQTATIDEFEQFLKQD